MRRLIAMVLLGAAGSACGEQPVHPVPGRSTATSESIATTATPRDPVPSATASAAPSAVAGTMASAEPAASATRSCPSVPACGKDELRCLGGVAMQAINGPSCDERCVPFSWAKARKGGKEAIDTNPFLACNGDLPMFCADSGECGRTGVCLVGPGHTECADQADTDRTFDAFELCARNTCRLGGTCETHPGGLRVCSRK